MISYDTLRPGARGDAVRELQRLLRNRGFALAADGFFGALTDGAVRAFQSSHADQLGQPLAVDGMMGPLTWWALTHPKPEFAPWSLDFAVMPPKTAGGIPVGRAALAVAIAELQEEAREIGGNNRGLWVRKYLHGLAPEGNPWCAAFVSWCYAQHPGAMPFDYTLSARDLLNQFRRRGWAYDLAAGITPAPGDIVVWWRGQPSGWQGHAGLVYGCKDGMLYTIEGNRTARVQGFSYVLSRMEKLLGFGRVG